MLEKRQNGFKNLRGKLDFLQEVWKKTKSLSRKEDGTSEKRPLSCWSLFSEWLSFRGLGLVAALELEAAVDLLGLQLVVLVDQVQLAVAQRHPLVVLPAHEGGR